MLTCKDVATAIGRDEWRAASWRRRLALRLHLLMCSHCRRYAAQIRAAAAPHPVLASLSDKLVSAVSYHRVPLFFLLPLAPLVVVRHAPLHRPV